MKQYEKTISGIVDTPRFALAKFDICIILLENMIRYFIRSKQKKLQTYFKEKTLPGKIEIYLV